MRRTKWAAAAAAVIALGAAGCDTGTGAAAAPLSPRPTGTGPLTRQVVRADLDTAAADAEVPASEPEYSGLNEDAPAGTPRSCGLGYKAVGRQTAIATERYDALVRELRERDWRQRQEPVRHKDRTGGIYDIRVILQQRGWTMVAEYSGSMKGIVTLLAYDDACMKQIGASVRPIG
ncbi:hypothetical protein ABZ883_09440 [Streptomyces sp. NPDC046977]|uniref:hypothetical protein n=1 Tax=Streptomyces sp. NPDC046977 TaxID=3154703 RepID=UPI0033CACE44